MFLGCAELHARELEGDHVGRRAEGHARAQVGRMGSAVTRAGDGDGPVINLMSVIRTATGVLSIRQSRRMEVVETVHTAEVERAIRGLAIGVAVELVALQAIARIVSCGRSRCDGSKQERPLLVLIHSWPSSSASRP